MEFSATLSCFSNEEQRLIERMAKGINLASTVDVANFCNLSVVNQDDESLPFALGQSPTTLLAAKIAEIVAKLKEADPRLVSTAPGWFARKTGAALETNLRYQVSRKAVDTLISEAERLSARVLDMVVRLEQILQKQGEETRELEMKLCAGRLFLERNPDAGIPKADEIAFDNPRERFARRLASMAAVLSSSEMNRTQLNLARVQAIDMVERFHEISHVLVPLWRQHTFTLTLDIKNPPAAIADAASAHESLLSSLTALKSGANR